MIYVSIGCKCQDEIFPASLDDVIEMDGKQVRCETCDTPLAPNEFLYLDHLWDDTAKTKLDFLNELCIAFKHDKKSAGAIISVWENIWMTQECEHGFTSSCPEQCC